MGLFRWIEEAAHIMRNNKARKENERRGQEDLRRREVEALERIAQDCKPRRKERRNT